MSFNLSRRQFGLMFAGLPFAASRAAVASRFPAWAEQQRHDLELMALTLNRKVQPWQGSKLIVTPEEQGYEHGKGLATPYIQKAIESAAHQGGGTVRLAQGDYVSGTIDLKSNIRLEIAEGSRLLASLDLKDWPDRIAKRRTVMDSNMGMNQSLIFAEGCTNISLAGKGTIDGRGASFQGEETIHGAPGRPFLIRIIDCQRVHVAGLTMLDSPCWMQNYLNCDDLLIEELHVENQANFNNDGCDLDGCRNVIVRNCYISSGDDSICFKGASLKPTENVLVENCTLFSSCNALKLGTDSQSVFRNLLVRNLTLGGVSAEMRHIKPVGADSGISWEVVDGATAENILVTDIHIARARSPLFMRLDDRGRTLPDMPRPPVGKLRRIVFDRVDGELNGPRGSYFLGMPDHPIEDIVLREVHLSSLPTQKSKLDAAAISEMHDEYPDAHMIDSLGDSPAAGLWTRHVNNLTMVNCTWRKADADPRPTIIVE